MSELTADDYTYRFPDHWLAHEKEANALFTRLHTAYVERAIEIIQASGAKTVLEVGCGDGWNCGRMAELGLDVVGTDWSKNGINYAKQFAPSATFFRGDVRDNAFLKQFPNKFDAVALIEVIEHIPPKDCIPAMINIASPLKEGGTFVLTTPSTNFPNNNPLHYQHFTAGKLREICEAAGLIVKSIEGYGDQRAFERYWQLMRWADNRLYSIKPLAGYFTKQYHQKTQLTQVPLDRCQGLIVTAEKPANVR